MAANRCSDSEEVRTNDHSLRKPLGFFARFGILFLAAIPGALIAAALGVPSSSCVMVGGVPAMMVAYAYLQSKGLIAKRTKTS